MKLILCPDCGKLLSPSFPIHDCNRFRIGASFTIGSKQFRIHRIQGNTVFYVPAHYGAYPPKGTIRKTTKQAIAGNKLTITK